MLVLFLAPITSSSQIHTTILSMNKIVHELVALELLIALLESPTDDSVEVGFGFDTQRGSILQDICPRGLPVTGAE